MVILIDILQMQAKNYTHTNLIEIGFESEAPNLKPEDSTPTDDEKLNGT